MISLLVGYSLLAKSIEYLDYYTFTNQPITAERAKASHGEKAPEAEEEEEEEEIPAEEESPVKSRLKIEINSREHGSILERMSKAKTKEDGRKLGIEIAREICDRIADRVAGYQVSAPFGIVDIALQVLE